MTFLRNGKRAVPALLLILVGLLLLVFGAGERDPAGFSSWLWAGVLLTGGMALALAGRRVWRQRRRRRAAVGREAHGDVSENG